MIDDPMPWLDQAGPEAEIVVSSRIRLARNLVGYPFSGRNSAADREEIRCQVEAAAVDTPPLANGQWHRLDTLARTTRLWLHERQQSSRDLAGLGTTNPVQSGASLLAAGTTVLMVNEEDHLRLQEIVPGFAPKPAYTRAAEHNRRLGTRLSFAFHPEFGYLTGCPTNVGTGLRASVLIHLPLLVWTREIGKVLHGLSQVGVTCRGFWGEGSEVLGDLFQLSNQTTLGRSEAELLDHLERLVGEVIRHERRARSEVWDSARRASEDRVWRSWGILRHARLLGFVELAGLLSDVRLGVALGVLPSIPMTVLNRLLVVGQDAHVARWAETKLEDEALPAYRTGIVRQLLDHGELK